jgi:hypothetical protein
MDFDLIERFQDWRDAAFALAEADPDDPAYDELLQLVVQAEHRYEQASGVAYANRLLGFDDFGAQTA